MRKTSGFFVKINYKANIGLELKDKKPSVNNSGLDKYILCGGIFNKENRTLIFKADNIDEAREIINNNPFSHSYMYSYQIVSRM